MAQALALVGFAIGALIVFAAAPFAAGPLETIDPPARGLIALAGMATIVLVAQALGSAVRRRRSAGAWVAACWAMSTTPAARCSAWSRGIFLVWLAGGLIALAPLPVIQAEARQSLVLRVMDTQLPSPVVLAAQLGRVIEAAGLPTDVFVGVPPPRLNRSTGQPQQAAERIAASRPRLDPARRNRRLRPVLYRHRLRRLARPLPDQRPRRRRLRASCGCPSTARSTATRARW